MTFNVRKSNIKSARFQTQLEASCESSHTEELQYNETLSVDDDIYASPTPMSWAL